MAVGHLDPLISLVVPSRIPALVNSVKAAEDQRREPGRYRRGRPCRSGGPELLRGLVVCQPHRTVLAKQRKLAQRPFCLRQAIWVDYNCLSGWK